ncbi:MAG: DUF2656 family protein [Thermosynechococcaceae cyanobacterium]
MLLSHNFDLVKAPIPALSRLAFLQVMAEALKPWDDVTCTEIDNPHWMVDIGFDPALRSPQAVGECCAQALFQSRLDLKLDDLSAYAVLVLGGIKTSPPWVRRPHRYNPASGVSMWSKQLQLKHFCRVLTGTQRLQPSPLTRFLRLS